MLDIDIRAASIEDFEALRSYAERNYRASHPFLRREYWQWFLESGDQYLAIRDGEAIGTLGVALSGGFGWVLNLHLEEACRGLGVLSRFFELAAVHRPLATANVNHAGHGLFRKLGWIRYCDLQRFSHVNPRYARSSLGDLVAPVEVEPGWPTPRGEHYWKQPGLDGALLGSGNTAVRADEVGGLRAIDIVDHQALLEEAWAAGYRWVDFMTSWNDPLCRTLEDAGWHLDDESPVPWLLDPVFPGSVARVSLLSQDPLPKEFIMRRCYSDHGRVGSLP